MQKIKILCLAACSIVLTASLASSTVIDGALSTQFYSYRARAFEDQSHLRSLQGARLNVRDAFIPGLSLYVRGRIASDISNKFSTDPDFRVYGAYIEYNMKNCLLARGGRQFLYAGLQGLTMDGGRVDLSYKKLLRLTGFAGTTPGPNFYDYDKIRDSFEAGIFGGRLNYSPIKKLNLAASFMQRERDGNIDYQLLGADLAYKRANCSQTGRVDFDLNQSKLSLISLRHSMSFVSGHSIDLEYLYRRPLLPFSNLFSVVKNSPFHQFRVNPVYQINNNLSGVGTFAYTKYKTDNNVRFSAGARYNRQSAGLVYSNGYGGTRLGVFAFLNYAFNEDLDVYANADMYNYKLDKDEDDTNSAISTAIGGNYNIIKGLSSRAEVQVLNNIDYKYDTRFYLSLTYGFRTISGGGTYDEGGKR